MADSSGLVHTPPIDEKWCGAHATDHDMWMTLHRIEEILMSPTQATTEIQDLLAHFSLAGLVNLYAYALKMGTSVAPDSADYPSATALAEIHAALEEKQMESVSRCWSIVIDPETTSPFPKIDVSICSTTVTSVNEWKLRLHSLLRRWPSPTHIQFSLHILTRLMFNTVVESQFDRDAISWRHTFQDGFHIVEGQVLSDAFYMHVVRRLSLIDPTATPLVLQFLDKVRDYALQPCPHMM